MMKTRYYMLIMMLGIASLLSAQDISQALRYSQIYQPGSARYAALGGSLSALGGDYSVSATNPAGLGVYRKSEFVFSPFYRVNSTWANYLYESTKDHVSNMAISNIAFVTVNAYDKDNGIVSSTFSFGYNLLNDFNEDYLMSGVQPNSAIGSSILDNFVMMANSVGLDPYYEQLAFDANAMPFDENIGDNGAYWHNFQPFDTYNGYGQEVLRQVQRSGSIGEYAVSGAINMDHKIYVGATLAMHSVRYYEDVTHIESDDLDLEPEINSIEFGEYNSTVGHGYAFKAGVIFKPIQSIRLGASFHAPISYQLTDEKFTEFSSSFDPNSGIDDAYASYGMHAKEYTLKTPARIGISGAFVLGRLGFISAEYEMVDYSLASLDSRGYDFAVENVDINRNLTISNTIKLGAEVKLFGLAFRTGFQHYGSPYTYNEYPSAAVNSYSFGLGLKSGRSLIDFSYVFQERSSDYGLYELSNTWETAEFHSKVSTTTVTLRYKF